MTNNAIPQDYEVKAGLETLAGFDVVGVSEVITDNENASFQINALWEKFFKKSVGQKVDDRDSDVIYAVYSDYEGDHTKPYRVTIGYKVSNSDNVPAGFHHVEGKKADYAMMSAAGEQPKALLETWTAIWQSDLDRKFETDFEVYGPRFFEDGLHEVLIAIGVNV